MPYVITKGNPVESYFKNSWDKVVATRQGSQEHGNEVILLLYDKSRSSRQYAVYDTDENGNSCRISWYNSFDDAKAEFLKRTEIIDEIKFVDPQWLE